jgi:hypothetical protein
MELRNYWRVGARLAIVAAVGGYLTAMLPVSGASQKFYPDDPISKEPETQDASKASPWNIDLMTDLIMNMFARPGDLTPNVRAQNLNTIDEVPDSSWFTNRVYARPVSVDEIARGPNTVQGPAAGPWVVTAPKSVGAAPGFIVRDERQEVWFLTFDPAGAPRAATGAIAVACRLFWALGYYQVESYLTSIHPENLSIASTAKVETRVGHVRPMKMSDVRSVLNRVARNQDGTYRVMASRRLPGKILGGFRYYGTRPDDPNDLVPHEHRRELRALKVFGAWTNLVDLKAGNTLDSVITENGRGVVRHYLQDVGSTFGSGAQGPHGWEEGYEYVIEGNLLLKRMATLGLYLQPWQTVNYVDNDEIGPFEGDEFDPTAWKSRVSTAAEVRARSDDNFWAALRVMAFTDEMIRKAVEAAEYADPESHELLGDILIKRRDKIGKAYLPAINPLVRFGLDDAGNLTFQNAAVRAGVASAPTGGYRAEWQRFDNATGATQPIGQATSGSSESLRAPDGLPRGSGTFIKVAVSAVDPARPTWAQPVQVYFRRLDNGWKLVGLERLP